MSRRGETPSNFLVFAFHGNTNFHTYKIAVTPPPPHTHTHGKSSIICPDLYAICIIILAELRTCIKIWVAFTDFCIMI